ncbi:unnamed protein product, partial [Laminaria digitata]
MRWLLPLVGSYSEPWQRPWSRSPPAGRPVRGGVPSPVAVPAKLCAQRADPDSPACPTSVELSGNWWLRRYAQPACRPLEGLGPGPPLRLDPFPTKVRGRCRHRFLRHP